MRAAPLLLLFALGCGAFDPLYRCQRDEQCVTEGGVFGRCVDAACAWPAPDCGSGLRFDESAGPDRGGACTEVAPPGETAARFLPVPLPGGEADAPRLGPLFGDGAVVYAAGWDGQPFLLRHDGQQGARLQAPLGSDAVVCAAAGPGLLALATADRLLLSMDGGQSFAQRDFSGVAALHHDGQLLHLLRGGQVESLGADLSRADLLAAPEGAVVALAGAGPAALALVRGAGDSGVVYLRRGAWRRVYEGPGPLTAAAIDPAGAWAAAGPGALVLDGAPAAQAPISGEPRQLALLGADLWLRDGGDRLLLRAGGAWREVRPDAAAAGYDAIWRAGGDAPSLWTISRFAADRTYRGRLWRSAAP